MILRNIFELLWHVNSPNIISVKLFGEKISFIQSFYCMENYLSENDFL